MQIFHWYFFAKVSCNHSYTCQSTIRMLKLPITLKYRNHILSINNACFYINRVIKVNATVYFFPKSECVSEIYT